MVPLESTIMPAGIAAYDMGGSINPTGIASGVPQSSGIANAQSEGQLQQYQGMTEEQLQELAMKLGNSPQGQIVNRVLQQKRGQPAQASAMPQAAGAQPQAFAGGGTPGAAMGDPWWAKQAERDASSGGSGLLHSAVAGRTDHLQVTTPAGAYVMPADVVSGLGEGNSLAGARVLQSMFSTGPGGIPLAKMSGNRNTIPRAPTLPQQGQAKGGKTEAQKGNTGKPVPILAAGGEFIIHPGDIARKFGSVSKGHKALDKWVVSERQKIAKTMLKLPGPAKS